MNCAVSFACSDVYSQTSLYLLKKSILTSSFTEVPSSYEIQIAWNWLCYQSNANRSFESYLLDRNIREAIRWKKVKGILSGYKSVQYHYFIILELNLVLKHILFSVKFNYFKLIALRFKWFTGSAVSIRLVMMH